MKFFPFFLFLNLSLFGQIDCATKPFNFTGFCFEYHENLSTEQAGGKIAYIKEFKNDEAIGIWMKFDDKGNLISQLNTRDKKDSLGLIHLLYKEIEIVDEKKEIKENVFETCGAEAVFPIEYGSLSTFVQKNINIPSYFLEKVETSGKVYVKFLVESDGSISNIQIVRGFAACPDCDQEVLRVMRLMPNWIPAESKGEKFRTWIQYVVNFTIH